jgi:hypothetical protein
MRIEFTADVYRWESRRDLWCFVAVPPELSEMLRELPAPRRGFGSIPVSVTVAPLTWRTSIFPESATGRYVLPLKGEVRRRAGIGLGDLVTVSLETIGV